MSSDLPNLRSFVFTCPTCGEKNCTVVFSTPFDPKAPGAVLGFTHHDAATNQNDPMGFAKCGLVAHIGTVKVIDGYHRRGVTVPQAVMESAVRGKAKP